MDATEDFWAGSFGDAYIDRNCDPADIAPRIAMFTRILARTTGVASFLELGANIGLNLLALKAAAPGARLKAVEINKRAFERLATIPGVEATLGSLLDYQLTEPVDLAFTSGVLIHVDPVRLTDAYRVLYEAAARYVLICEYYNPTPVEVSYRGHAGRLFKRDFAGELLDQYPGLQLVDYGFIYRRDPVYPADDVTWFLMRKAAV
jgi:pseudaminic acid biosynthesis-associated methylase